MNTGRRIRWLQESLRQHIQGFEKQRLRNRSRAFALKVTIVTLGSLTTVAIGLGSNQLFDYVKPEMAAIALIFSAIVTVASACEAFFDYRWLWIKYTATYTELRAISADLEFALLGGANLSDETLEDFYARLKSALRATNNEWLGKHEERGPLIDGEAAPKAPDDMT